VRTEVSGGGWGGADWGVQEEEEEEEDEDEEEIQKMNVQ
jgi:hypothetical protein